MRSCCFQPYRLHSFLKMLRLAPCPCCPFHELLNKADQIFNFTQLNFTFQHIFAGMNWAVMKKVVILEIMWAKVYWMGARGSSCSFSRQKFSLFHRLRPPSKRRGGREDTPNVLSSSFPSSFLSLTTRKDVEKKRKDITNEISKPFCYCTRNTQINHYFIILICLQRKFNISNPASCRLLKNKKKKWMH